MKKRSRTKSPETSALGKEAKVVSGPLKGTFKKPNPRERFGKESEQDKPCWVYADLKVDPEAREFKGVFKSSKHSWGRGSRRVYHGKGRTLGNQVIAERTYSLSCGRSLAPWKEGKEGRGRVKVLQKNVS